MFTAKIMLGWLQHQIQYAFAVFGYSQNGFTVLLQYLLMAYINSNIHKALVLTLEYIECSYKANLLDLGVI